MKTTLYPYLHFKDNAREAMEFYQSIFGGKLDISTFKDFPMPHDPSDDNKVMHSMLEGDNGISFMASDTPKEMSFEPGHTVSMTLSGDNEDELRGYWDKLSQGATITVPLDKAPWGDIFGMLKDKFGIEWMIDIGTPKAA